MADLYTALAGLAEEEDYLARSPWYLGGLSLAKSEMPVARNNTEAFLMPILQGLGSGALMGFGRGSAADQMYLDAKANPFTAGTSGFEAETRPEDMTAKQIQAGALLAALTQQQNQAEKLKNMDYENQLTKTLAGKGVALDKENGGVIAIPGFAEAQAKVGQSKDWVEKIPAQSKQQLAQLGGITSKLDTLSEKFKQSGMNAVEFQSTKDIAGTLANSLNSEMTSLVPVAARLMGEVGNLANEEQVRQVKITLGNWTSGTESAGDRIKALSDTAKQIGLGKLNSFKLMFTEGGDALVKQLQGGTPSEEVAVGIDLDTAKASFIADLKAKGVDKATAKNLYLQKFGE